MTYLLILIAYALAMILIGAFAARRVTHATDFFVAGRDLPAGLIFATLLAANIGAGSTVGATGLGYRDGLSAWWWVGSAGIGSLILAFTVGPRIWRVACEQNLFTVGDYLEFRYDRRVRGVVAAFLWLGALAILANGLGVTGVSIGAAYNVHIGDLTSDTRFKTAAVPEPSTYALMGLGLVAAGFIARRRNAA